MNWLRSICCALCLVLAAPTLAQTSLLKAADSVVYLEIRDKDGALREHGSGLLVGLDGYVLTAQHLLKDYDEALGTIRVSLKSRQGQNFKARKLDCTPPLLDVCLLYISSEAISIAGITTRAQLACGMPSMGQNITAAGYPVGDDNPLVIVPGIVSGRGLGSLAKIVMSNAVIPGMSGGPIFNQDGEVIGLVWGKDDRLGVPLFTPLMHGKMLLGMANVDCPISFRDALGPISAVTEIKPANAEGGAQQEIADAVKNADKMIAVIQKDIDKVIENAGKDKQNAAANPTIFIQISSEAQRKTAVDAISAIRQAGMKAAGGVELVTTAPSKGQIRYFSDENKEAAERVAKLLSGDQLTPTKVNLANRAAPGVIEIWYPKT